MKRIIEFLKKDITFTVAGILCIASIFFITPDKEYLSYINLPVLTLLFCLMAVVSGFEKSGLFDVLKSKLTANIKNEKSMIFVLVILCFFISALITNDVSLITFVPFSIAILRNQKQSTVIFCVVMETIAANLGSLITPIGNPQNLFLYTNFNMTIYNFFKISLPLGFVCLVLISIILFFFKSEPLKVSEQQKNEKFSKKYLSIFSILFVLCILSVLKIISCYITLITVIVTVFITDKKLFKNVDYTLLITFIFFFIFSGNIARIPVVYDFIKNSLLMNETIITAVICQFISNVPAATMLSSFTDNAKSLLIGTNIGGLGTIIASMASLISYRYICQEKNISSSKYMITFSIYNFILLIILLAIYA